MTPPPFANLPLVDEPYLRDLHAAFGDARLKALFDNLAKEAQACGQDIKLASAAGDLAAMAFSAHKLKGMAQNLGVPRLSQIAREIEAGTQPGTPAPIPSLEALDEIITETTRRLGAFV